MRGTINPELSAEGGVDFGYVVFSDEVMKDYKLPSAVLTRSPGHYRDWIRAAKGGDPSCSNFSVAGPFVQWMLLGVVAMHFEGKLMWDAEKGQFTNNKDANVYLKPNFRKGWKFS